MPAKLTLLAERLIECSRAIGDKETLRTLVTALESKLKSNGNRKDIELVLSIQGLLEVEYDLHAGALNNSFSKKDRNLTEPKLLWVAVCLHFFKGDKKKVANLIGNGINYQKVWTREKVFADLNDQIKVEKKIKEKYDQIINSYE